jgi:hypothetical protein
MRLCWLSPSSRSDSPHGQGSRCQPRKASRGPFFIPKQFAAEPIDHPHDVHGGRGQHLLEVRPCQTNVPTLAQSKATHRLGEGTFHPSPERILGFELWRLLALPRRLERLVRCLGFHRELARCFG